MLKIQTDKASVEISPGSHFFLKRGESPDDSIRIEWDELDENAESSLNQLVTIIEGSLDAFTKAKWSIIHGLINSNDNKEVADICLQPLCFLKWFFTILMMIK